jgi:ribonuclease Z
MNTDRQIRRRRILAWGVGLTLALLIAGWTLRDPILIALVERVALQRMSADRSRALPDGLHVGLCGAGSPLPDEQRMGACTVVVAGDQMLVFDAGQGAARNLARMGFAPARIDAVFLTHFHSDHIDGLGELLMQRWVAGAHTLPVPLHGPAGVEEVAAGFMRAYAHDQRHRVDHHGAEVLPPTGWGARPLAFDVPAQGRQTVFGRGALEVQAFRVDHAPVAPAVGYRISYKGRSVVISGDTVRTASVQEAARGVDVLVHDAMAPALVGLLEKAATQAGRPHLARLMADITDYHATAVDAAQIAHQAQARYLLLTHIAPPLPLPGMTSLFLGDAARVYAGPIRVGRDGDFISLPAQGSRIDYMRLF